MFSLHVAEVYLLVDAPRSNQCGVQSVREIGGHDHDAPGRIHHPVEDIQKALRHCA